jgi:uncharacterized protein (TIGR01244 family)
MRTTLALLVLLPAAASAGVPETVDPAEVPNYKVIAPGIAAAGQPSAEVLPKLGALGFKTVLNLRMPNEGGPPDEQAIVESQGLRYVSVPVTASSLSPADVLAVEKVLDDPASGPVLLHCASANRVGGLWALVQARKGKSLDDALAAGREAGLRAGPMEDAVRRLLAAPAGPAPAAGKPNR